MKKIFTTVLLFLLLFNVFGCSKKENETDMINSHEELKRIINDAEDGDIIYLGDIDFSNPSVNIAKSYMQIDINKSITLKSGKKNNKATLINGMFNIVGNKFGDTINVKFENIIFDGNVNINNVNWSDRLWPVDSIDNTYLYYEPQIASHALSFSGNIKAEFVNCEFKNYIHEYGAICDIRYEDYTGGGEQNQVDLSTCQLFLDFTNCDITSNASFYYGGAMYIEANNNVTLNLNGCRINNNMCGSVTLISNIILYATTYGGGAIYANNAFVNINDCVVSTNCCDYEFNGRGKLNNSVSTRGGAFSFVNCTINMINSIITNNRGSMGGGFSLTDCKATIDGCLINDNKALVNGTNINVLNTGPICGMGQGGAFYVEGTGNKTVTVINCDIINNISEVCYGGIYKFHSPIFDPSLGTNYLNVILCTYINNGCLSSYNYDGANEESKWFNLPGDVWQAPDLTVQASFIVDDLFKDTFVKHELPSNENNYNYFASSDKLSGDKIVLSNSNQESRPTISFSKDDIWKIPSNEIKLITSNRYEGRILKCFVGANYQKSLYNEKSNSNQSITILLIIVGSLLVVIVGLVYFLCSKNKKGTFEKDIESEFEMIKNESTNNEPSNNQSKQIIIVRFQEKEVEKILETMKEVNSLTNRELEVFKEILLGKKQREIASTLFITTSTVKDFYKKIYNKMNVDSKEGLFEKVYQILQDK